MTDVDVSDELGDEGKHTECAVCGYEPDTGRFPPHYVLSLAEEDISEETVESYPFGGSVSVPFACSDECLLDAREMGLDRFRDSDGELVTDGGREQHTDGLPRFQVELELSAMDVLPWETPSPVEGHVNAEGLDV